jgi:hypothetical protein
MVVVVAEVGMAKVTIQIKEITHMEVVNIQLGGEVGTLLMAVAVAMVVLHMDLVVVMHLDQGMDLVQGMGLP